MAAFGNSPYGTSITTNVRGQTVIIVYVQHTDSYHHVFDTARLDSLVKEFKRAVAELPTLGKPRPRVSGRDYKTPPGTRPLWLCPEAPAEDPPQGVILPRWREYARRHV
jgi:hypothetical protein